MLGVFDSGLGGLSSVRKLAEILPNEDLVYFGDTGRVPYGTRSRDTIIRYAQQDLRFLETFAPRAILVACGTVSSVALDALRKATDLPVIGVVEPAVDAALAASRSRKIAVLGTPATVRSGCYAEKLKAKDPALSVFGQACPLFVPLVENGHLDPRDPITREAVKHYLDPVLAFGADTVILGCTHYPFLKRAIGEYVGKDIRLIDAGRESALAVKKILSGTVPPAEEGNQKFYVSDSPQGFADIARIFLDRDIGEAVKYVDIETY